MEEQKTVDSRIETRTEQKKDEKRENGFLAEVRN